MTPPARVQALTSKPLVSDRRVLTIHDEEPEADGVQGVKDQECIAWYVAHTQPLKEWVARQHLLDQGYEVYLPRFKKICRHARKVEEKLVPLFPRYIFVGMDSAGSLWRNINGTRGVSYVVMGGELTPARVPGLIISELKSKESAEGIVPVASLVHFVKGEKLRILEGAFADQMAVFESMDDKSRVHLLLTFMGREMKMTLPIYAVEVV